MEWVMMKVGCVLVPPVLLESVEGSEVRLDG
jgi:hypothetical protein